MSVEKLRREYEALQKQDAYVGVVRIRKETPADDYGHGYKVITSYGLVLGYFEYECDALMYALTVQTWESLLQVAEAADNVSRRLRNCIFCQGPILRPDLNEHTADCPMAALEAHAAGTGEEEARRTIEELQSRQPLDRPPGYTCPLCRSAAGFACAKCGYRGPDDGEQ